MTKPKVAILMALCKLDRDDVKATAYDSKLQERYYDVKTIARHIYGDKVFEDGKLKESTRSSLNQMLNGLYLDGFIDLTGGSRWHGDAVMREYWCNHYRLTSEGRRCLASSGRCHTTWC